MLPGNSLKPLMAFPFSFVDKLAHFFVFMILSIFFFADIKKDNKNISNTKALLIVLLISLFYGIIIEILQSVLTIDRSGELFDILANMLGVLTGVVLQIKFKILRY